MQAACQLEKFSQNLFKTNTYLISSDAVRFEPASQVGSVGLKAAKIAVFETYIVAQR